MTLAPNSKAGELERVVGDLAARAAVAIDDDRLVFGLELLKVVPQMADLHIDSEGSQALFCVAASSVSVAVFLTSFRTLSMSTVRACSTRFASTFSGSMPG